MKLLQLSKAKWVVYAIIDRKDACQVVDFLYKEDKSLRNKMLYLLQQFVPYNGPPIHNKTKAKYLMDDIFQFMAGPKKGAKLRVLYFKDGERTILCTEAFTKRDKTPQVAINRSINTRKEYFKAKKIGQVELVLPDEG